MNRLNLDRFFSHGASGDGLLELHELIDQEHVRQQCAQVDGGVQVVDRLGAQPGLSEHQFDGRQGVGDVPREHLQKRPVATGRSRTFSK